MKFSPNCGESRETQAGLFAFDYITRICARALALR